ncbi:MAG: hypothetical protein ACE5F1_01565 [Planctomycetota bacterium]
MKAYKGTVRSDLLYVGQQDFRPMFVLEHDPAPQTPQVIQGILWLASRTQGGTDPVVVNGDLALLIPEFQYSFDIFLDKGAPKGPADFSLQIPNDPVLQGLVMLFQYVAIAPNASQDTVVSDVFGSTILPAPSGGGSHASETGPRAPTWAKMTAKRRAEARKAFGQWLTRDKGSISPSGSQLIAAVQARLVRQHKKR